MLSANYYVEKTGGQIETKKELIDKLKYFDGCIIGSEKVDKEVFDACSELKILSRFGSGYNSIDVVEANNNGVAVTIVPNSNPKAVARHSLSLLLALTNNIVTQNIKMKKGIWKKSYSISPEKNTVGVIGLGNIGLEFAILCEKLGFEINYYSRSNKNIEKLTYQSSIESLIEKSDIISLHLDCNEQTKGIINSKIIKLMKGKYFINTSRGELVDELQLYNSLDKQLMLGAGIDVFNNEPFIGLSKKLAGLKNVIATSHTSCYDYYTIEIVGEKSLQNINYFFNGEMNKINKIVV